jgi:hypothetical protein
MSNLTAFFAQNAIKNENVKYAASKRFVGADQKPMEWEICGITSEEDESIRKACVKVVSDGKGKRRQETDFNAYLGRLAARCTVFPNLNDASLQDSYKVMGADVLLKTMLNPGEYSAYIAKVQEVNGFESMSELVEEAKN